MERLPKDEKELATLPINETQLRHVVRTERDGFEIMVRPLLESGQLWWTLRLRIPEHARDLLVVDAANAPRRWRQGNALLRFIIQMCGRDHYVNWDLTDVRAEQLHTRGEKRPLQP